MDPHPRDEAKEAVLGEIIAHESDVVLSFLNDTCTDRLERQDEEAGYDDDQTMEDEGHRDDSSGDQMEGEGQDEEAGYDDDDQTMEEEGHRDDGSGDRMEGEGHRDDGSGDRMKGEGQPDDGSGDRTESGQVYILIN